MVLEKTLESPLDCKEIQPVHSEGDQPWDFFGSTDADIMLVNGMYDEEVLPGSYLIVPYYSVEFK